MPDGWITALLDFEIQGDWRPHPSACVAGQRCAAHRRAQQRAGGEPEGGDAHDGVNGAIRFERRPHL